MPKVNITEVMLFQRYGSDASSTYNNWMFMVFGFLLMVWQCSLSGSKFDRLT